MEVMYLKRKYLLAAISLLMSVYAFAAPGDLDTSFGVGGKVINNLSSECYVYSVIQQKDGKLVAVGVSNTGANNEFALTRYNADGSLDTSFDGDGIVFTDIGTDLRPSAVIQQPDGKLVAAGYSNDGTNDQIALVRYNANGSLDTSFNGTGIVITTVGQSAAAYWLIQQADGKLVTAGYSNDGANNHIALVRYNANGSLDTSFNGSGIVITTVGQAAEAYSVIQQADGKLVEAGYSFNGVNHEFTLVRYNTNGSLDTGFNGTGIVTIAIDPLDINEAAVSVIQQHDGKLVAAGYTSGNPNDEFALVRYNSDGSLDTSFNGNGIVKTNGLNGYAYSIIQQRDGKLVVAGESFSGITAEFALVRYNSDGNLDATFNDDGIVTTAIGSNYDSIDSVIQQEDGKLVAAGITVLAGGVENFALARYLSANVKNDYNNDGISGWYWKGDSNGVETNSEVWQLTFPLYSTNWGIPTRSYPPIFADQASWEVMTTGDFNKDGDADILWRNKTTAQWRVWQMQNGTRVAQNDLADFDLAHEWKVIGAGDTDKDGDDDIILNNASTGEVMIWEMQDHAVIATHLLSSTKPGYIVNRIGDFNNDGDVDLMLSEVGGSTLVIWEIETNAFVQERVFPVNASGWVLRCAGDFDKDGDADIFLVNSSTQQEKWFEIESYARIAQHVGATNVGFVLLGCGDYNGDGDMDMLWQRSADDMNRVVLQQNWGATKQTVYTNPYGGVNPAAAGYGYVYRGNGN